MFTERELAAHPSDVPGAAAGARSRPTAWPTAPRPRAWATPSSTTPRSPIDGTVACVRCHDPARAFSDGLARAEARGLRGRRNTPSLWWAATHRWQLWDGAADSLWAQPVMAGSTRESTASPGTSSPDG